MKKYICVSEGFVFEANGRKFNECQRALYYSSNIGRGRVYRDSLNNPTEKSLKLFTYKNIKFAQRLCDEINKVYGDSFAPKEIEI